MSRLRSAMSSCARAGSVLKLRSSGCEKIAWSDDVIDGENVVIGLFVVVRAVLNDTS